MLRRFVPLIGLFAACGIGLAPAPAQAQVNIDQGKSASEMFAGTCTTCHKSAKGLANGRNSSALTSFLREHYTSSGQQAASLAAYVLGAGSGPAPTANLKPGTGGTADQKTGEAKPGDKSRPARPEPASTARLQPPAEPDTKVEAEPANAPIPPASVPGASRKPAAGKHEPRSVTASRGPRQEPETPQPAPEAAPVTAPVTAPVATPESEPAAPAPVATAPATSEPPNPAEPRPAMPATASAPGEVPESAPAPIAAAPSVTAPSAAGSGPATSASPEASSSPNAAASAEAPMESAPAEAAPVPRDDIPD